MLHVVRRLEIHFVEMIDFRPLLVHERDDRREDTAEIVIQIDCDEIQARSLARLFELRREQSGPWIDQNGTAESTTSIS